MRIRSTLHLSLLLLAAAGCAEWPRFSNLPADPAPYPATIDPAALVDVAWDPGVQEAPNSDNDLPTRPDVPEVALDVGAGRLFEGTLEGTGWSDNAEAEPITSASCAGATGTRSPLQEGDYIGDVDFVRVDVPPDSTLCARVVVEGGAEQIGWDLVPFTADACGIPVAPVVDETGAPLGVDRGGERGGWGFAATQESYVVLLAAYYPNDPELTVDYRLGVSVVPNTPDGSPGLCPLLPEETGRDDG